MASETSDRGESRYEAESGTHDQTHEIFFASAHHDHGGDDAFSAGQPMDAQNQPVQQVPIQQGTNVIRVPVTPGEILELAPPFTPDANLAAREADGNLAIKVGDVTVILEGFINANNTAPIVVETSDGKPIDVATVIAQTDPTIDIQTAAGPAAGPQGAENTGAILAQLAGGAGLGGFTAVGGQDGTSLTYGTIDNSIRQDLFLTAGPLGLTTPGFSISGNMSEPFLRDPIHVASGESYNDFITGYRASLTAGNGYADFNGTQSNPGSPIDPDAYLAQTTEHITIPSTGQAVTFNSMDFFAGLTPPTSGQHTVHVEVSDNGLTAYVVRDGDNAVIMVFHITSDGSTGPIQIDALLVDRIDHPAPPAGESIQDTLQIDFNTSVPNPNAGQGSETPPTIPGPGGHVDVLDDVPVVHITYTNELNDGQPCPADPALNFGQVDEDLLKGGNHDSDNPSGFPDDTARGDDWGNTTVTGVIDTTNYGADGPGKGPQHNFTLAHLTEGSNFLDANGNAVTQDHNNLVVLKSDDIQTIVGLPDGTKVFEITLGTVPNTFEFQLLGPIDELPGSSSEPLENNLMLQFLAVNGATDGDGDAVIAHINIQVNDDAPVAVNDTDSTSSYKGNVLTNDHVGADGALVTNIQNSLHDVEVDQTGADTTIASALGVLTIHDNGTWTYAANADTAGGTDTFTYTLTDGDGDQVQATLTINVKPTVEPLPFTSDLIHTDTTSYDVTLAVHQNTSEDPHTSTTYHITDATGGHVISGGGGGDLIEVTGSVGSTLSGFGGDDIIRAHAGHNTIIGGAGDDRLFGGSGVDDLYGGAGHDAMSGGAGDDIIHADKDDFSGSNLLDGVHSIDGGAGIDTLDLSAVGTFDNAAAARVENIEALSLAGGSGTTVTLNSSAVYGVTEVGGLHVLTISGDSADHVTLKGDTGTWTADGTTTIGGETYNVFHATAVGGAFVTVNLDQHITDQHANT